MSFTLFPLPSNVKVAAPAVRLVDTKTRRSLVLNAGALEASGIAPGSPLLIEHDGHLCRVRRPAGGEPTFGTLAKAKAESCGAFSTAGRILFDAGYAAGAVGCSCGDGWVLFDAEPLLPKGETKAPAVVQPPDSAPSPAVAPAAKPPSLPAADKPWPLAIEPGIAVRVLRMVVGGSLVDAIKAELGVELKDVSGVRQLASEAHIARLKAKRGVELDEALAEMGRKWRDRYDRSEGKNA